MIMARGLKKHDLWGTKKKELVLFSMRKRRLRKGKAISECIKICLKREKTNLLCVGGTAVDNCNQEDPG